MKKILLIPTYHYLSNPVYFSLKDILDEEYEFIYYFNKETVSLKGNLENISYDKVGKYFDQYIELDYDPLWVKRLKLDANKETINLIDSNSDNVEELEKVDKLFQRNIRFVIKLLKSIRRFVIRHPKAMYSYNRYVEHVTNKVKEISPDVIVINSDMTLTYRIIKKYFPNSKLVVLQACFIDFRERKLRKSNSKKKILNFLLKGVMLPKQPYVGLEDTSNKLLLFEDKFIEFYKNKRKNIYRIYNPYFTQLHENIAIVNKLEIKSKFSNDILDISKKPTVVIFIMDYTSIHGKDVQQYTEDSYKELVGAFENDFNFIIKNHPRAPALDFQNEIKSNKNVIFLKDEITYDELLALGDLNISINSNASLESLVAGMPTVNFLPLHLKENEHFKWLSYYCGLEAHTYEDLEKILKDFLKDRESFMDKVKDAQQMLVGTREQCKQSFLKAFEA